MFQVTNDTIHFIKNQRNNQNNNQLYQKSYTIIFLYFFCLYEQFKKQMRNDKKSIKICLIDRKYEYIVSVLLYQNKQILLQQNTYIIHLLQINKQIRSMEEQRNENINISINANQNSNENLLNQQKIQTTNNPASEPNQQNDHNQQNATQNIQTHSQNIANTVTQNTNQMNEMNANNSQPMQIQFEGQEQQWQSESNESEQISQSDQQQIDSDNGQQEQKVIKIKQFDDKNLPKHIKKVWQNIQQIQIQQLKKYVKVPKAKEIDKQVCAKVVTFKDTIVECYNCRMDQTCIICIDCFKNSDHTGHKYIIKKAGGGCCDCGDPQAWKEEGFCKNHSGKFKDFQIEDNVIQKFSQSINGLMYIYFHLVISKTGDQNKYTKTLIKFLMQLNEDNLFYNKLTALCLTKKLPQIYSLNNQLDGKTILQNILTTQISDKYFKHWFDLCISMFSYYPFKLDILKHYIKNYGLIVNGTKVSIQNALSISCQLTTSYKLVQQYSKQENKGIGQDNLTPNQSKKLFKYFQIYCQDLSFLCNLAETAPLSYWRMHINTKQGLKSIFYFYDYIMKRAKSYQQKKTQTQLIVRYIKFIQIQFRIVEIFSDIVKIISVQAHLLQKIIYFLWHRCSKYWNQSSQLLPIFRPYERCLTIALFSYLQFDLQNIPHRKQKLLKQILKTTQQKFQVGCTLILKRMFSALFFYSKCQAQHGLAQSLYLYLFMYKTYSKVMCMSDSLSIKIFLLLLNNKYSLTFQSIIGLDRKKLDYQVYAKEKTAYFINVLAVLKYLFVHFVPQIYTSLSINSQNTFYLKQIKQLILNYFKQFNNSIPQAQLKNNLIDNIVPSQCKIIDNWVKQNCVFSKQKKAYYLQGNLLQEVNYCAGLNFSDFWSSLSSKDLYNDIPKTMPFIRKYNINIFSLLWNQITIESLQSVIGLLFPLKQKQDTNNISQILPFLLTLQYVDKINKVGEFQKIKKIIQKYIDKIPASTLKLLEYKYEENQIQDVENLKKIKSQQLKAKKLQKFKKKTQNFLQSQGKMIQQKQQKQQKLKNKYKKYEIQQQEQQQIQNCCCICKNETNENSVIIVNLSVRNHQKLLKVGKGIQCLSINSCKHVFDLKCIQKMYNKKNSTNSVTCPLCKYQANMLYPASNKYSKELALMIAERVIQILNLLKTQNNFYQEIIKSFYHYILLCSIDFSATYNKKGSLYRTLLQMLKNSISKREFEELNKKFIKKQISKYFDNSLKQDKIESGGIQMLINLLNNTNQAVMQLNTTIMDLMQKKQSIQQPKQYKKQKHQQKQCKQYSKLFQYVTKNILNYLSDTKNQMQSQNQFIQSAFQQVNIWLDSLLKQNFKLQQIKYESYVNQQKLHIFKNLPQKYTAIGQNKKCSECSQFSAELIMCLMCPWQGCQKCQKGYAKIHVNQIHGEVGAVMKVQKGIAYYITNDKTVSAGFLYQDERQSNLQKASNWDQFQLNFNLMNQMQRRIVLDDLPTRGKKNI